ncbi:MAG: YodC family protein [Bacteroidota bacterium]
MSESKPFPIGTVVVLKSGGPKMTVSGYEHYGDDEDGDDANLIVSCVWFDAGACQTDAFPPACLDPV